MQSLHYLICMQSQIPAIHCYWVNKFNLEKINLVTLSKIAKLKKKMEVD